MNVQDKKNALKKSKEKHRMIDKIVVTYRMKEVTA